LAGEHAYGGIMQAGTRTFKEPRIGQGQGQGQVQGIERREVRA
jgi:hypothetical protein